jgi:hypothetical protein
MADAAMEQGAAEDLGGGGQRGGTQAQAFVVVDGAVARSLPESRPRSLLFSAMARL